MSKDLADRWLGHDLVLDASPFGLTADGLQDYRAAPSFKLSVIEGQSVHRCDFSSAVWTHARITNCSFKDCVFNRADLRQIVVKSSTFENCRFRKADLRWAQIGYLGSVFDHCEFERVQVARTGFHNVIFQNIEFRGEDWRSVDFGASGFWNCAFIGVLHGVMFRGDYQFATQRELFGEPRKTGLHHVSFERAELSWVGFTNACALEDIVLPKNGSAFLCQTDVLLWCESRLSSMFSEEKLRGIEKFFEIVRVRASTQKERIVSRNDIVHSCGSENGSELYVALKNCVLIGNRRP